MLLQHPMPDPDLLMMIPVFKLFIVGMVTAIVATPLVRALAKRLDRPAVPRASGDADARLARIEQAVDAIAIEVERISEAQRFATKLLSERAGEPAGRAERPR